ncbi:dimethyladenosine transferase [Streptococcus pneumoniae GA17570]|nr:dimethyladenosine transferase [Streptococcus pneumoniae GA17570]
MEAEKQAALKEIENTKTMEDVKEAETIGVQAIAMVTVPKRPVAPNAAPKTTSTPQATAGTMQDVTYQYLLANNYLTQVQHQVQHLLVLV